jgi:hypothetical protein
MLTLRISHEEYETYRAAYPAADVRSPSELARVAMKQLVAVRNGSPHSPPVDDELPELRQRAEVLSSDIQRIREELDGVAAVLPRSSR